MQEAFYFHGDIYNLLQCNILMQQKNKKWNNKKDTDDVHFNCNHKLVGMHIGKGKAD